MFFRFGSKSGKAVPPAGQALEEVHSQLQQQQHLWTEKLAQDPSCFAALEQEVHLRFGQLAGLILWGSTAYSAVVNHTGKGRGRAGSGLYPELAALGIHHGKTAALVDLVARQSALLPSFEHARRELTSHGLDLPLKEVRRIATHLGAQVLTRRKRDLLDYRDGRLPAGQELAGKRVACCIDAGKSRLRRVTRKQKGKGKTKKQRRRYKTDWRDVKLLIIYEIDAKGETVRTSCPWIDGTFGGPDEAMELLAMHLHRLGAAGAEVVVFLADGAPWIWERLEWVARRVGLRDQQWLFVLDFWHAAQHIGLALGHVPIADKERRRLYRKLRKWLKGGKAWEMIQELRRLGETHGVLEVMQEDLGYLEKHEGHCHLDYARFRRRGLPLGPGSVESDFGRVINLRIKGPGVLWEDEHADVRVALRAAALSGRWEELLEKTRQSVSHDRRIDFKWTSPDMRAELKADVKVQPPTPQVQQKGRLESQAA